MKAVILCAGQGSRLRPFTDDRPKGMVEVAGRPILEWQREMFQKLGIHDIVVVGGYRHETIPRTGFTTVVNDEYATTNMAFSLFSAMSEMESADAVVVSYADILYSPQVLRAVVHATGEFNVVVDLDWYDLFSRRAEDVLDDAETLKMAHGCLKELGRKPESLDDIEAQYIGLMKFDGTAISKLRKIFESALASGESIGWGRPARSAYMTDLIQEAINLGEQVEAVKIRGSWFEIDTPEDLRLAQTMVSSIVG